VTAPNRRDASSLFPLYELKPKGCRKYRIRKTMTQYNTQSLIQGPFSSNGYFLPSQDIFLSKRDCYHKDNDFLKKSYFHGQKPQINENSVMGTGDINE
jgi:hypothetical protein